MKYKTFRALVIGGVVVLGFSLFWWWGNKDQAPSGHVPSYAYGPPSYLKAPSTPPSQPPALSPQPLADVQAAVDVPQLAGSVGGHATPEAYLLATLGKPATSDKLKDVTNGSGAKINVYNEGGVWARAKVDHDRDEKSDEKWSLDGATIVRQIAPADDEVYTRELRKTSADSPWFDPSAPAPATPSAITPPIEPATPTPPAGALSTGREVDGAVMALLSQPVQEKIKDATRGKPYKVNLYSDDKVRWNRAKVDLDRDDKDDEKWTFNSDGTVERQVSPGDDEQYSETYVLKDGGWARK